MSKSPFLLLIGALCLVACGAPQPGEDKQDDGNGDVEACGNDADDDGDGEVDCDDGDCDSSPLCGGDDDCGDGVKDPGEACDGDDVDNVECEDLGFTGGVLGCTAACALDTDGCEGGIETCDNGQLDALETCDGDELDGATCTSLGYDGGTLGCNLACTGYDTSDCNEPEEECGDDIISGDETCDGDDLDGEDCQGLGWAGGDLACDPVTCQLDETTCFGCGDGFAQGSEQCDTNDFPGDTTDCADYFEGAVGTVTCNDDCTYEYDGCTSGGNPIPDFCEEQGWYGDDYCDPCELMNGVPDAADCAKCVEDGVCVDYFTDINFTFTCEYLTGSRDPDCLLTCGDGAADFPDELCDGADLLDLTCDDFGYAGAGLACNTQCSLDFSGCEAPSCGNDAAEGFEDCDGSDVRDLGCGDFAEYSGGVLACDDECGFDFTGCTASQCGDGTRNGDEDCDTADLGGATCQDLGFEGGALACDECGFDTSGCFGCGDGVREGWEVCDGDDGMFDEPRNCASWWADTTGTVSCADNCMPDFSACEYLGDPFPDLCEQLDWYDDGFCDLCEGLGGTRDGDCDDLCGGGDECVEYIDDFFGVPTCEALFGTADPDCQDTLNDGVIGAGELCDCGGDACTAAELDDWTCDLWGYGPGTLGCVDGRLDASACTAPECRNGTVEGYEDCDGTTFRPDFDSCDDFGTFTSGTLACKASCRLDFSGCIAAECGNNVLEPGETCDTAQLDGATCANLTELDGADVSFAGGVLGCNDECTGYDASACFGCGDGVANGLEICDGDTWSRFYSRSCADWNMGDGQVGCTSDCFPDLSTCQLTDFCDEQDPSWYGDGYCDNCEALDSFGTTFPDPDCADPCLDDGVCADYYDTLTGIWTCQTLGAGPDPDCGTCEDGNVDVNEYCDADGDRELVVDDCNTYGLNEPNPATGSVRCNADCTPNLEDCGLALCGDAVAEGYEDCDEEDLRDLDCTFFGFEGGTLACDVSCGFDTSGCGGAACGNDTIEQGEDCDGTTFPVDFDTCQEFDFDGGTLGCDPVTCTFDVSSCVEDPVVPYCGDGAVIGWEVCDPGATGAATDDVWGPFGTAFPSLSVYTGFGSPACRDYELGLSGTITCGFDCSLYTSDFSECAESDVCEANGWYEDGICDACPAYGGREDGDCAVDNCGDPDGIHPATADDFCDDYYDAWVGFFTCGATVDPGCVPLYGNGAVDGFEWCDDNGTDEGDDDVFMADDTATDVCLIFGYTGGEAACDFYGTYDFTGCTTN